MCIRLWPKGTSRPAQNIFNRDVWARVTKGFLYIRTYAPRIDLGTVHVVEGGKLSDAPGALDIAGEEID